MASGLKKQNKTKNLHTNQCYFKIISSTCNRLYRLSADVKRTPKQEHKPLRLRTHWTKRSRKQTHTPVYYIYLDYNGYQALI